MSKVINGTINIQAVTKKSNIPYSLVDKIDVYNGNNKYEIT